MRHLRLGGLEPEEAAEYADVLLAGYPAAAKRRAVRAFAGLLAHLDGHPLALRIILPQLEHTEPDRLVTALAGLTQDLPAGFEPDTGRTESLGACVAYSLSHLPDATSDLLAALTLFEGIADVGVLAAAAEQEDAPARMRGINRDGWEQVLDAAADVGLLTRIEMGPYGIHPALPAYLSAQWRSRAGSGYDHECDGAISAMIGAYAAFGLWLYQQIEQGDAGVALALIGQQRRSMGVYLTCALERGRYAEALRIATPLDEYWNSRGLTSEANAWVDRVRVLLEANDGNPPPLGTPPGDLWLSMVGNQGRRQVNVLQLDDAQRTYSDILKMLTIQPQTETVRNCLTVTYHQLGVVAQQRGELGDAEAWYRRSLEIQEQLGHRSGMASCYHQLGVVAQDRGDLDQAEAWIEDR